MVYKCFGKKILMNGAINNDDIWNQELTEELHKTIIRKFWKRKIHSSFLGYICGADLSDYMQLISKFNER